MPDAPTADFLIVGGGIAGASIGHALARHGRVTVLEGESQPGAHSTGRSAALFMETYGTPQVRALTRASRAFLAQPPSGFSDVPLLAPRGALWVAADEQLGLLEAQWQMLRAASDRVQRLDGRQACALVPVLRPERVAGGVYEPDACDIDVDALHQGYLRGLRRQGGRIVVGAEVTALRHADGLWQVETAAAGRHAAPVVVNAAGAWADVLAARAGARPIGLQPRRRAAFIFAPPAGLEVSRWPMCIGADETWYMKPDAGMLLGSPANADAVEPHDVQPEELDIALGIHHIEAMTTLRIVRPTRTWAGLRSFVADGDLVGGYDAELPGFFWLAAQGGYGIQTAPAMAEACAALVVGESLPEGIAAFGLTAAMLSPRRLRPAGAAT